MYVPTRITWERVERFVFFFVVFVIIRTRLSGRNLWNLLLAFKSEVTYFETNNARDIFRCPTNSEPIERARQFIRLTRITRCKPESSIKSSARHPGGCYSILFRSQIRFFRHFITESPFYSTCQFFKRNRWKQNICCCVQSMSWQPF